MDSPISQLDLSKFPTITPTPPQVQKAELDRRSQGITAIKNAMENLVNLMHSYLTDLQEIDSQARLLEQQKAELLEIEKQVRFSHHQLEVREKELNKQSEYIENWNKEHKNQ